MTEAEAERGNIVFCLKWLAPWHPDTVIEATKDWKYVTTREKRDMAIKLHAISGRLVEALGR